MLSNQEIETKLNIMAEHNANQTVIMFIRLLYVSGARISDLLRLQRSDFLLSGVVVIRQSKGSQPLRVSYAFAHEWFNKYRQGYYTDISCFNSYYFWRIMKRYNLQMSNGENRNFSVTHSGRKIVAQTTYNETGDIALAQSALGHKSTRSTEYYLTPDQKRAEIKKGILSPPKGDIANFKVKKRYGKDFIYMLK